MKNYHRIMHIVLCLKVCTFHVIVMSGSQGGGQLRPSLIGAATVYNLAHSLTLSFSLFLSLSHSPSQDLRNINIKMRADPSRSPRHSVLNKHAKAHK